MALLSAFADGQSDLIDVTISCSASISASLDTHP